MKFTKKTSIVAAMVAAVSFWAAFAQTAYAASTTVSVGSGGDVFTPSSVTISVNDSVIWNWVGTPHTSTSGTNGIHGDDNGVPCGNWDTGIISTTPHTFTNTFTSAGTFLYYCTLHVGVGMKGQVLVNSASIPPTLAITSPSNGAEFAAPANVAIQASVTNGSAPVTDVQFYTNDVLAGNVTTAPFTLTPTLGAGNYALTAAATAAGTSVTSSVVNITVVTPVAVSLSNLTRSSGTNFQFTYGANVGLDYVIQRATSLVPPNWVPIATNVAASNPTNYVDVHATSSPAFYRVGRLPNP